MARTALIVKCRRRKLRANREFAAGKKLTFPTRIHNRCERCGKIKGYMKKFRICRICFRELAREGKLTGVSHSSW